MIIDFPLIYTTTRNASVLKKLTRKLKNQRTAGIISENCISVLLIWWYHLNNNIMLTYTYIHILFQLKLRYLFCLLAIVQAAYVKISNSNFMSYFKLVRLSDSFNVDIKILHLHIKPEFLETNLIQIATKRKTHGYLTIQCYFFLQIFL